MYHIYDQELIQREGDAQMAGEIPPSHLGLGSSGDLEISLFGEGGEMSKDHAESALLRSSSQDGLSDHGKEDKVLEEVHGSQEVNGHQEEEESKDPQEVNGHEENRNPLILDHDSKLTAQSLPSIPLLLENEKGKEEAVEEDSFQSPPLPPTTYLPVLAPPEDLPPLPPSPTTGSDPIPHPPLPPNPSPYFALVPSLPHGLSLTGDCLSDLGERAGWLRYEFDRRWSHREKLVEDITRLYGELDIPDSERMPIPPGLEDVKLVKLADEYARLKTLLQEHLVDIVDRYQGELDELWDTCMVGPLGRERVMTAISDSGQLRFIECRGK